jgi:hypothetical protein
VNSQVAPDSDLTGQDSVVGAPADAGAQVEAPEGRRPVRSALIWAAVVLAVAMVAAAAAAAVAAIRADGRTYSTEALVVATPREGSAVGTDLLDIVTSRYLAYLSSPSTQRAVAAREGIPLDVVEKAVASRAPGTINIVIASSAPTAETAAQVANAMASAAVAFSSRDELVRIRVLAPAVQAQ